jgi:hypothetical protein
MKNEKPLTLSEHLSRAAKARHQKKTPAERSNYARMMVRVREEKRKHPKGIKPPSANTNLEIISTPDPSDVSVATSDRLDG